MRKILLVDDDKGIIDLISQYLLKEGFEVRTAGDGLSGLKAVESYRPDLIVLDIMLPGFDGLELLTKIRQRSQVYVIMLTAKIEETDKIVGLTVGADDYMVKPFSPRELVANTNIFLRLSYEYFSLIIWRIILSLEGVPTFRGQLLLFS